MKDNADPQTRKKYIQLKANELQNSDVLKGLSKQHKEQVIQKVADNSGCLLIKYEDLEFSDEEIVVMRNYINVSTNAMYRLKQVLEVLWPELRGKLIPAKIRVILQELENNGVVPAITKRIELQVSGDETKRAMRTYYYVSNPGAILELQTIRSILDGTYQQSFDICNFTNKTIMCWGIDKRDTDLNCAQRVFNRINGNSSSFVQGIASAEKSAETHGNLKISIFSHDGPTGWYLQRLTDDSYPMLTVTIGGDMHRSVPERKPLKATCALFLPYPRPNPLTQREIEVEHIDKTISKDSVTFAEQPPEEAGLPPKVPIPVDQNKISVQPVRSSSKPDLIVGYQINPTIQRQLFGSIKHSRRATRKCHLLKLLLSKFWGFWQTMASKF